MLEDMRRGTNTAAYQNQGNLSKLTLDQHPPRVLGAPQAYPPGPVSQRHRS